MRPPDIAHRIAENSVGDYSYQLPRGEWLIDDHLQNQVLAGRLYEVQARTAACPGFEVLLLSLPVSAKGKQQEL